MPSALLRLDSPMTDALTPSAGHWQNRVHKLPVRVYYEDTDFTGMVYHANYLRYLERGRSDALRAAKIAHAALLEREKPLAFTIYDIHVTYRKPARIDDALVVETAYDRIKGPRLIISQRITCGSDTLVEAKVQAVTIDMDGRPRRFPKDLHSKLSRYLLSESH